MQWPAMKPDPPVTRTVLICSFFPLPTQRVGRCPRSGRRGHRATGNPWPLRRLSGLVTSRETATLPQASLGEEAQLELISASLRPPGGVKAYLRKGRFSAGSAPPYHSLPTPGGPPCSPSPAI